MLGVEGLAVRYGPIEAVRSIDFTVNHGEVFAVLGANGAGKSSTLAAIAGLVKPFSGRILYDGKPVSGFAPETLSRAGIGLVPEGRRIFASLTVAENLWLGGAAHGSTAERHRLQQEMEDRFPILRERTRQKAGLLSGGEQQMLAIGRALVTNPHLVILDEATEGLAPLIREEIWTCLAELRRAGQTILVIDKYVERLIPLADRHTIIERGRVAWQGTSAELDADHGLWHRYLGV